MPFELSTRPVSINDLTNCVQNSVCRLFVDDCFPYQRIRSCHDSNKLQADLDQRQKWESIWLMEFHTSKCQVISITNKVKPIIGNYQIHDHILEQVNCDKHLGIYIDSKLAFHLLLWSPSVTDDDDFLFNVEDTT